MNSNQGYPPAQGRGEKKSERTQVGQNAGLKEEIREIITEVVSDQVDALREEVAALLKNTQAEAQAPLDSKQACKRLNCSRRKLDELVALGELRPLRLGRKRLFPAEQLEAFLRKCAL